MNSKVVIIGGGLGGLTLGYLLSKKGNKVTILEKEKFLGGLLAGFEMEGTSLERTYHHIFRTDKEIIGLIKELGLEDKLKWYKSSVGLYRNGKIYPFMGAIDLLKFPKLGLIDKLRLGLVYIWLKFDNNWKKYEKTTAIEWMTKWAGKKAFEVIWEPLMRGKFHRYADNISMAWLWARIHTRGGSKDEKGNEVLGYLDGGFEQITQKLAQKIKTNGGKIILNKEVNEKDLKNLEKDFELIIDTRSNKNIDYLGAITLVFSTKQNLSKFYWHNINDLKSPFIAFIQHTNLVNKSNYNNKHIYYLGTYVPQDHKYFKITDKEIEKELLDYLKKIKPEFDQNKILEKEIFKMKYAQHIVSKKYKAESYKVSKKVYKLNFAQIYPEDRGINFAVREAKKLVKMIENN